MGENICSKCGEKQYSAMDKKYLELYGHCWSCDNKRCQNKEITLEEFEKREKTALEKASF